MRYELLVFDWDGTLMDSAAQIVGAMQNAIQQLDLPARTDEELRRLIGLGLDDAFRRLYPDLQTSDLMNLAAAYRRLFGSTPQVYGKIFPGVEPALDVFTAQGRHLAVATGKSRRGLDRTLQSISWQDRFRATRCADETAGKPHPKMLEELLWQLQVLPERALMIGDTSYDMEMAGRAGMDAVAVSWGVHDDQELLDSGASCVLPGVPALVDWLAVTES